MRGLSALSLLTVKGSKVDCRGNPAEACCGVHAEGSGWNAGQPAAKRQKRSGMRRLFDCLNPSAGFGPNTEDEVWRGSSYDALLDGKHHIFHDVISQRVLATASSIKARQWSLS